MECGLWNTQETAAFRERRAIVEWVEMAGTAWRRALRSVMLDVTRLWVRHVLDLGVNMDVSIAKLAEHIAGHYGDGWLCLQSE